MWSVEMIPYFVELSLPSTIGRISRWPLDGWLLLHDWMKLHFTDFADKDNRCSEPVLALLQGLMSSWFTKWSDLLSVSNWGPLLTAHTVLIFSLGRKFWTLTDIHHLFTIDLSCWVATSSFQLNGDFLMGWSSLGRNCLLIRRLG